MVTNQTEWIEDLKGKILLAKSEINEDQWPEFVEWLIKETEYEFDCSDVDCSDEVEEAVENAKSEILQLIKEA